MFATVDQQGLVILCHLDVNKTLVPEDLSTKKSVEYILSSTLAEKTVHVWDHYYPAMSYREYTEKVLAHGDKTRQKEFLGNFISFLETSNYSDRFKVIDTYRLSLAKMEGQYLVPSFRKLVRKMQEQNIAFRIILRTFGKDIHEGKITQEIDRILDGSRFQYWGNFKGGTLSIHQGPTLEKVADIYKLFQESSGHFAIQDDYKSWDEDGGRARSGKHFIFDPNDRKFFSVIIDDNVITDPDSECNIVHPVNVDGSTVHVHQYLGRNIFVADVIEAILDDNYFIDIINKGLALAGHDVRVLT